jgi:hypothetical protein
VEAIRDLVAHVSSLMFALDSAQRAELLSDDMVRRIAAMKL